MTMPYEAISQRQSARTTNVFAGQNRNFQRKIVFNDAVVYNRDAGGRSPLRRKNRRVGFSRSRIQSLTKHLGYFDHPNCIIRKCGRHTCANSVPRAW